MLAGIIDKHVAESVNYFESQIKPHIDGEQVKYVGPVNTRQKISLLSKAHGFLNPIQWEEPFGMVMIEAMAVGCPVISFGRGAAPEIVAQGKTGFLVDTLEEMVACIPQLDELDRSAIRDYVLENFSVKAMAEKYLRIYEQVIASKKSAPKRGIGRTKSVATSHSISVPISSTLKTSVPVQSPYQIALPARAKRGEKTPS